MAEPESTGESEDEKELQRVRSLAARRIILSPDEIEAITDYKTATRQLDVLRRRGFNRAFIGRMGGVILERSHYEAITSGREQVQPWPIKTANREFIRGRR